MTNDPVKDFVTYVHAQVEITVQASLKDPDIMGQSNDFKQGYAKGLREGLLLAATERVKRGKP
jgi:hypothetical protein